MPTGEDASPDLRFQASPDSGTTGSSSLPPPADTGAIGGVAPAFTQDQQASMPGSGAAIATEASAPPAEWLEQVCPYLLSEDGTWRSTQPDPGHRCMAQDPPGELPPMFQERFCLSDSHVRCEWFKAAQQGAPAVAASTPDPQPVKGVTTSPASSGAAGSAGGGSNRKPPSAGRPLLIGGALIGGFLILVLIALVFGTGDGSQTPLDPDATPATGAAATPAVTEAPAITEAPVATAEPTEPPTPSAILIRYEVQEDERLLRIGEKFGIRRGAILRANEDIDPKEPDVQVGQEILIPAPGTLSRQEIEAIPGFVAFIDEEGA